MTVALPAAASEPRRYGAWTLSPWVDVAGALLWLSAVVLLYSEPIPPDFGLEWLAVWVGFLVLLCLSASRALGLALAAHPRETSLWATVGLLAMLAIAAWGLLATLATLAMGAILAGPALAALMVVAVFRFGVLVVAPHMAPARSRSSIPLMLIAPAAWVVCVLLIATDAPFEARFAFGEGALTDWSEEALEGTRTTPARDVRIGTFKFEKVFMDGGCVWYDSGLVGIFIWGGLVYCPEGVPMRQGLSSTSPVAGNWWKWEYRD